MEDIYKVLDERGKSYGDFTDNGRIAQAFKTVMRDTPGWDSMNAHQKEALEMIAHKIARILNGNPNHPDSWVDIIGYTQLVIDRLPVPIPPA